MITRRCDSCTSSYCPIPTDGPVDADVYAYAERPGQSEQWNMLNMLKKRLEVNPHEQQLCLIGDAGEEFNETYLPLAGLGREQVRVGNVVLCGKENNKHPSDKEIEACSQYHVAEELAEGKPKVVILMGASACQLVPDLNLEVEHGIPRRARIFDWEGCVVAMFHPAAGMHQTSYMIPLLEDWERFGEWLSAGRPERACEEEVKDYRLVETKQAVEEYFHDCRYWTTDLMAIDTESHNCVHWSTQVSILPHTGIMALAGSAAIHELNGLIADWPELVLHNAPADLPFIPKPRRYRDTMVECYNLGNLPQGLKALSYRLFGRRRKSWEEMVGRVSKDKLVYWMMDGLEIIEKELRIVESRVGVRGQPIKPIIHKPQIESDFIRIMRHTITSQDYDPWEKLKECADDDIGEHLSLLVERLGPIPLKGIANLPLKDAIFYGCSDSDDTLQLAIKLEHLRKDAELGWAVAEEDYDAVEVN